jgi:peptidoglycan/xylan/chitin deacetylase (PgdA/CDA1 family)
VNVHVRRRLVAGSAIAAVGLAACVALWPASGESGRQRGSGGPIMAVRTVRLPPQAQELAAAVPQGTVPLPRRILGHGPFVTVDGAVARRSAAHGRGVALTFDDGPGQQTEAILDELALLRAPATFFVIGEAARAAPGVVRAERAAGMTVGDHTWSHPDLARLGAAAQQAEVQRTQRLLRGLIGVAPRFFRPPMWDWTRVTARAVAQQGLVTVLFSIDTQDWKRPGVRAIVHAALQARPGDVIAMHDAGGDRTQTLRALPAIVRGLRARGLHLVTLDRLYQGG